MLIARYFGATAATDAFYVAFRLPNMLRRLFAEGAFQQAFVPMLSDVHANSSPEAEKRFIDHVFTVLAAAVLFASVLGVLAAPLLVWLIASGLRETPEAFDLAAALTRVMFPYIAFMSLVALAASILNTLKKFAIPAATPILLNLSFIVCSVVLAPRLEEPIWALAAAVVLGGVLQLAAQILALARLGVFVRPRSLKESLGDSAVRRVLALMAPAVFGVGVAQLSILINTNIASWLGHGAVTWLNYADRLMEFPTALLGVALGTVLLPSLSSAYAKGKSPLQRSSGPRAAARRAGWRSSGGRALAYGRALGELSISGLQLYADRCAPDSDSCSGLCRRSHWTHRSQDHCARLLCT